MNSSETASANAHEALRTQTDLLHDYSLRFDEGDENYALPMATSLRVLLHDTKSSHSVFWQLGVKDRAHFTDTAHPLMPGNLAPSFGLVISRLTTGSGGRYLARSAPGVPPSVPDQPPIPFEKWWHTPLSVDVDRNRWSRWRMVKVVTNKLGGAHLDPKTTAAELKLSLPDSFGWQFIGPRGNVPFENSPLPPSIRQISFELLDTVEREALLDG